MNRTQKLYNKAKDSTSNIRFNELCQLAEYVGFEFRRQKGSHKIYKHPTIKEMLNFQPDKRDKSKAKRYQVNQLLEKIDEFKLMGDGNV